MGRYGGRKLKMMLSYWLTKLLHKQKQAESADIQCIVCIGISSPDSTWTTRVHLTGIKTNEGSVVVGIPLYSLLEEVVKQCPTQNERTD